MKSNRKMRMLLTECDWVNISNKKKVWLDHNGKIMHCFDRKGFKSSELAQFITYYLSNIGVSRNFTKVRSLREHNGLKYYREKKVYEGDIRNIPTTKELE